MNESIIILFIIFILILWNILKYKSAIYESFELDYDVINNIDNSNTNCCLINKEYIKDNSINNLYGGKYIYKYKNLNNSNCDYSLYDINSTNELILNTSCDNIKDKLGSCRISNKECIEFVTKDFVISII